MRTFTEVDDDLSLAVVPGAALPRLRERLEATQRANARMTDHYLAQKQRVASPS